MIALIARGMQMRKIFTLVPLFNMFHFSLFAGIMFVARIVDKLPQSGQEGQGVFTCKRIEKTQPCEIGIVRVKAIGQ